MYRYGAALALLACVAAGCSDEHAGSLPPVSTSTPSVTAAATTSGATPASEIEAAARAYYDTLNDASWDGSVAALRALITPGCSCKATVDYVARERQAGHRFTTKYVIDAVHTHDVTATAGSATVTLSYAASKVVDTSGKTVRPIPGEKKVGRELGFTRKGDRWLLTRFTVLPG